MTCFHNLRPVDTQAQDLGLGQAWLSDWQGHWGHQVLRHWLAEQGPDEKVYVNLHLQASDSLAEGPLQDRQVLRPQGPELLCLGHHIGLAGKRFDDVRLQEVAQCSASGLVQDLLLGVLGRDQVVPQAWAVLESRIPQDQL